MKIAHITNFFEPKYYASNEYFICHEMTELGHEVVLFCPDRMPRWVGLDSLSRIQIECEKNYDFLIKRIPSGTFGGMILMPNLLFDLVKGKFDIIHSHEYLSFCTLQSAIVANMVNCPLIITQHNDKLPASLLNRFNYLLYSQIFGKFSFSEAKKIIALTNDIKSHLLCMGANEKKIEVIPNAVDTTRFSPNRRNLLEKNWKISSPVILFVGRLTADKGVEFLFQAFSKVIKEIPDAKLVIVGWGERESELRNIQRKFKIKNIFFLGRIPNKLMPNIYSGCDVLVLPSFREIFGNVVLEAMATGKPVIGSYVGGMKEIIAHGKTGYLIPPKNSEKISEFLITILKNEKLNKKLGRNARKRIIKYYSYEQVIKNINELYIKSLIS